MINEYINIFIMIDILHFTHHICDKSECYMITLPCLWFHIEESRGQIQVGAWYANQVFYWRNV